MAEYRMRAPVRAMQVDALHLEEVEAFVGGPVHTCAPSPNTIMLVVETVEGNLPITGGMWIVEYLPGHFIGVGDEAFRAVFEATA